MCVSGTWLYLWGSPSLGTGSLGTSGNPGPLFHMRTARKLRKSKLLIFVKTFFPGLFLELQTMVFLSFPFRTGKCFPSIRKGLCSRLFISRDWVPCAAPSLPRELGVEGGPRDCFPEKGDEDVRSCLSPPNRESGLWFLMNTESSTPPSLPPLTCRDFTEGTLQLCRVVGKVKAGFLSLGTVNISERGLSWHCGIFSSILGLYPAHANSTTSLELWQPRMSWVLRAKKAWLSQDKEHLSDREWWGNKAREVEGEGPGADVRRGLWSWVSSIR